MKLHPPSDCANMCICLSFGMYVWIISVMFSSLSITLLHISSADLLYPLRRQLTKGVAGVAVCHPWSCHLQSMLVILSNVGTRKSLTAIVCRRDSVPNSKHKEVREPLPLAAATYFDRGKPMV